MKLSNLAFVLMALLSASIVNDVDAFAGGIPSLTPFLCGNQNTYPAIQVFCNLVSKYTNVTLPAAYVPQSNKQTNAPSSYTNVQPAGSKGGKRSLVRGGN